MADYLQVQIQLLCFIFLNVRPLVALFLPLISKNQETASFSVSFLPPPLLFVVDGFEESGGGKQINHVTQSCCAEPQLGHRRLDMDVNNQDWMSALPEELWDIPLTELAIPGSHDAMSYCLDITSPLLRSESDTFWLLDRLFYCVTRPLIFKWATTQDKSIEEQLSKGIRFFDLRVAHKPNDPSDDLYFTHVIYTHLTVLKTLECVEHWLNSHPKEVVILACSHFEGMDDACHELFISHLKKLFGSKLCPRKEPVLSLRRLWASGYQVILSYESQLVARHPQLWPAIPYWWANKIMAQEVIRYLDWNKDMGRPDGFFVSGLNLTAPRSYIARNPKESLRTLTFSNWECLREWVEQQRPGSDPHSLNIIAGDFVGPLPLCSLVIGLNHKLRPKISARFMKEQQQQL